MLTAPPYRHPETLVLIQPAPTEGRQVNARRWSAAQWSEWQRDSKAFESFAGYGWSFNFLVIDDGSESLEGMFVSKDYFRVVGLEPVLGRRSLMQKSISHRHPSSSSATTSGNGSSAAIPTSSAPRCASAVARLPDDHRRDAAGSSFLPSPATAQEPNYNVNAQVDFWAPLAPNPERLKAPIWDLVGRLREGVTIDEARAELEVMAARQAKADPDFDRMTPQVQELSENFNQDARRILFPLFGAAALVLLISCGNVAALLLVRGLHRQDEYAVRSALGVRRLALFRQVSVESLLLALLGGAIGIGMAIGIVRLFKVIAGPAIPRLRSPSAGKYSSRASP